MRGFVFRWLKGQVPLGVFIGLSLLTIFTPNQEKVTRDTPAPLSIYAISHDAALQPVIYRPGDYLHLAKPSKNDAYGKRLSAPPISSSPQRYFISKLYGISSLQGSFATIFKRQLRQACQLLDLPPPWALS